MVLAQPVAVCIAWVTSYMQAARAQHNSVQQCIDITNVWNSIGMPRSGNINAERLRCKSRYKQAIKDAAFEADQRLNAKTHYMVR